MIQLLGAIGWGLLACGAITHVWHHRRLRSLLAMHLDHERIPALFLTTIEVALAIALPAAVLLRSSLLRPLALVATALAGGFMIWIGRLLLTGSDLPCACSFSAAPSSMWSFARSLVTGLVGFFVGALPAADDVGDSTLLATLAVGWAVGAAIFVAPEAVTWPTASKALMARVDAHTSTMESTAL